MELVSFNIIILSLISQSKSYNVNYCYGGQSKVLVKRRMENRNVVCQISRKEMANWIINNDLKFTN